MYYMAIRSVRKRLTGLTKTEAKVTGGWADGG